MNPWTNDGVKRTIRIIEIKAQRGILLAWLQFRKIPMRGKTVLRPREKRPQTKHNRSKPDDGTPQHTSQSFSKQGE